MEYSFVPGGGRLYLVVKVFRKRSAFSFGLLTHSPELVLSGGIVELDVDRIESALESLHQRLEDLGRV